MTLASTMKAVVYEGPGQKSLESVPKPRIAEPTDAITRMTRTTICGTDLHILCITPCSVCKRGQRKGAESHHRQHMNSGGKQEQTRRAHRACVAPDARLRG